MTKKLKLSEFLIDGVEPLIKEESLESDFTYPLNEFVILMSSHKGSFLVNQRYYSESISSDYSLYFYEGEKQPFLLMFTSITDIKKKDNKVLIFSDDQNPVTIILT